MNTLLQLLRERRDCAEDEFELRAEEEGGVREAQEEYGRFKGLAEAVEIAEQHFEQDETEE